MAYLMTLFNSIYKNYSAKWEFFSEWLILSDMEWSHSWLFSNLNSEFAWNQKKNEMVSFRFGVQKLQNSVNEYWPLHRDVKLVTRKTDWVVQVNLYVTLKIAIAWTRNLRLSFRREQGTPIQFQFHHSAAAQTDRDVVGMVQLLPLSSPTEEEAD
jgi:hypothetical protein